MRKITKLKQISQLIHNMGWRYVRFRGLHEIKKRTGLLEKKFPVDPAILDVLPSLKQWQLSKKPFFNISDGNIDIDKTGLAANAERIKSGEVLFFNSQWYNLGVDYDWVTNPENGFKYCNQTHWTRINDFSKDAGDIKYVWEKSRFSFIHTLLRDSYWNSNDNAEFIFQQIDSWIDKNPINKGPNYLCSQEISIRVLNWIWVLYYYSDHPALTQERWGKIIHTIYWQIHHVYNNINFSRIAVRNNHAITESLTLFIVGLLFPELDISKTWKNQGKHWFEEEVAYQVYKDGTFLQFSMNYHRVLIQLFSWAIGICELNNEKLNNTTYDRAYSSLNFLYQCQEDSNGKLPNYGANDGALFFPLNSCTYRDYRPQLNLLHRQLCGKDLYEGSLAKWNEDAIWFGYSPGLLENKSRFSPLKKKYGCFSFDLGGYYLIRETDSFTFIKCGSYKDRPAHADNLHIDIWVKGENILIDGGTYKYNTDETTLRYFTGTSSHNTVMIDNKDQMLKGARFIWYYWTQCVDRPVLKEMAKEFRFEGTIRAYTYMNKNIIHKRVIKKIKFHNQWKVEDWIEGLPANSVINQLWHFDPSYPRPVNLKSSSESSILPSKTVEGWYSEMYGFKQNSTTYIFSSMNPGIKTNIVID